MQLILVDNGDTPFMAYDTSSSDRGYYSSNFLFDYGTTEEVTIRRGTNRNSASAAAASKLVFEIVTSKVDRASALNIYFSSLPPFRDAFGLRIKSASESEFNILKELRDRFQDKVEISLSMKGPKNAEEYGVDGVKSGSVVLSTKGMKIDADNTCSLGSVTVKSAEALKWMGLVVQVTAYIPDEAFIPKVRVISVPEKNQRILEEGLFSDVIITAENGLEIKAHRSFLAASSPVFQRMFGTRMEEAKTGKVDMTDISEEGVRAFLRYIYFNDTTGPNEDIQLALELLYAAHKYDVQALEMLILEDLLLTKGEEDFRTEFAFKTYMLVRNIESACALKAKVIRILQRKEDELKTLPEYKELCETNPQDAEELSQHIAKKAAVKN